MDSYRLNQQDKRKTQKLVVKFLSSAAENFADEGRLDNLTDRLGRECLKAGCKHPVFRAISHHVNSWEFKRRNAKAREDLPKTIDQLKARKAPPILVMLAQTAQCDIFRSKNIVNRRELDTERADEFENDYNESILAMLAEESKCPENVESLRQAFTSMIVSDFRSIRHLDALFELISKSDLHEGFKQAALQRISYKLARSRKVKKVEDCEEYLKSAVKHGEKAVKQLLLSDSVVQYLGDSTGSRLEPEACMKWYEIGTQRAPGRYSMYRSYLIAVAALQGHEKQADFVIELLNSENFETGIPWIGIRLINERIGSRFSGDGKGADNNKKVLLAFEALLKKAPEQGKSPAWCKKQEQFLCHTMLQAEFFDDALRVAKDFNGDFGNYEYKGQKLTLARIAELANPLVREAQEAIEAGTFDVAKIEETLDELALARMDFGPNESTYIDELQDLLESVEAFESGKWANLTPETVHLSNWQGYQSSKWQPTENGISIRTNNSSIQSQLGWRWKVDSEYILEADIEITRLKNVSKKSGAFAGFGISNGKHINVLAVEVLINPLKSTAVMNAFRKKRFDVKRMLTPDGINRVRMRVWKDYFEFTINGKLAGQYLLPSAIPGHVILKHGGGAAEATFRNVRVKKLTSPSPTFERIDDVSYWSKRLRSEPDSKDIQLALETAKAKQEDGDDQQDPDVETSSERTPLKVGEGLVALWTFDQDLSESVSKGETQSALPTKLVSGKLGSGLLLSEGGSSNLIVADGEGPTDLDGPFTVSFWARCETENGVLISQSSKSAHLMVKLFDGNLKIEHHRPRLHLSCRLPRDLPLNTWQHITITYDGSPDAKGIEVFLDGKKRKDSIKRGSLAEDAGKLPHFDSSTTQMHFGCDPFAERPRFGNDAVIDEVRVYDRKLSADEIKQVKSYGLK